MAKTTLTSGNINKPTPLWFRKVENALLIAIIPASVAIIQSWGFTDELNTTRLLLIVNVGLTALVRATGMFLGTGDTVLEVEDAKLVQEKKDQEAEEKQN